MRHNRTRVAYLPWALRRPPFKRLHQSADMRLLAHDAGQTKTSFSGNGQSQLSDFFWLPLTALGIFRFRFAVLLLTYPAVEGRWADDGDEFFDGSTDGLAELEQSLPLLVGRMDLFGNLDRRILFSCFKYSTYLASSFCRGDQGEKRVENLAHRCIFVWTNKGSMQRIERSRQELLRTNRQGRDRLPN